MSRLQPVAADAEMPGMDTQTIKGILNQVIAILTTEQPSAGCLTRAAGLAAVAAEHLRKRSAELVRQELRRAAVLSAQDKDELDARVRNAVGSQSPRDGGTWPAVKPRPALGRP